MVAIKCAQATVSARLEREAELLQSIEHPHIVSFVEFRRDSPAYLVMGNPGGGSVDDLIKRDGAIPIAVAVGIVGGVLDALEYLHAREIIHGDIKPGNVILDSSSAAYLADFGTGRYLVDINATTILESNSGTPSAMAPEQIMGRRASVSSDLFSVAVLLYELLSGRKPFAGDSVWAVSRQILQCRPVKVSGNRPQTLGLFDSVLDVALQLNPLDRYPDAVQFRLALDAANQEFLLA